MWRIVVHARICCISCVHAALYIYQLFIWNSVQPQNCSVYVSVSGASYVSCCWKQSPSFSIAQQDSPDSYVKSVWANFFLLNVCSCCVILVSQSAEDLRFFAIRGVPAVSRFRGAQGHESFSCRVQCGHQDTDCKKQFCILYVHIIETLYTLEMPLIRTIKTK